MKFLVDRLLGRLSTWLRVLGFDAAYFDKPYSREILYISLIEHRIIITRNHRVSAQRAYGLIRVESNRIEEQLKQVVQSLTIRISKEKLFTRCTYCNEKLAAADATSVYGKVPSYIYRTHASFSLCPRCRRIYWAGTHDELLKKKLLRMGLDLS